MKKFLIIFCLVSGALFVHADKDTFVGLSTGVYVDSTFLSAEHSLSIDLGKEIQNSQGTYLGVIGLGFWTGDFEFNYGYHFLRTGNWSLGIEASAHIGTRRDSNSETERTNRHLVPGGRIGLNTRLKISESFDLGLQIGARLNIGAEQLSGPDDEEAEWDASDYYYGYYAHLGLRYSF